MRKLLRLLPPMALAIMYMNSRGYADAPQSSYFNGFERDTAGWYDNTNGGDGKITRTHSGYHNAGGYADGINSASGNWHARLFGEACTPVAGSNCYGPFTRWGGYNSTFPPGGYLTQLDIYLDVNWAANHPDSRFDWTSAINQNAINPPVHRRDWVFNVGTQLPGDLTPGFWVNASTNAFRDSSYPENPCPAPVDPVGTPPTGCRMPVKIATSGWYTFRHTFRSGFFAGCPETACLIVDFDILNQRTGSVVAHWTIDSSQDPMSMVGGNRYGWFANEEIPDLPIDNTLRTGLCHRGDGDGDDEDEHGGEGHHHFHKRSTCGDLDDKEDDNVRWDDDHGSHVQSTTVTASTFAVNDDGQILTMVGTGIHNGLPVGFTMMAVDSGEIAPSVFQIILSDGYTFTGNLVSGAIDIQ